MLAWGRALLLVTTDGRVLTVALGEQAQAACAALRGREQPSVPLVLEGRPASSAS